jgi:hypothetical protein
VEGLDRQVPFHTRVKLSSRRLDEFKLLGIINHYPLCKGESHEEGRCEKWLVENIARCKGFEPRTTDRQSSRSKPAELLSPEYQGLWFALFVLRSCPLESEERTRVCHCAAVFRSNRPTQPQSGAVVFAMRITRTRHGTSTSNCWTQTPTSAGIRINSGSIFNLNPHCMNTDCGWEVHLYNN